ncbi:MAG: glycoside hydrolase [Alteromonas sp.]|nr:glycoside hydrolase [Alteromonas sp.]MAY21635.1 glycoside hydrolase [Flavobacteriaceae bacterium]|tara:strand:- start:36973 stop:37977 length:1005 start_codon:yes stop_codon:yes gene_type:complete
MRVSFFIWICGGFLFFSCAQKPIPKINGVSFVASRDSVTQQQVNPIKDLHSNYAAIMPFGFIRSLDHPDIVHNTDRQWFGETVAGAAQYIELLHQNKVKVMLKPQLWIWRGEFTGHLTMKSEADWQALEKSYRDFILTYAYLAEEQHVDLFCIGTELQEFVMQRPQFWKTLVKQVRSIYSGKLTYAANWDEYKRIDLWEELDFIGVDAYFPISESKTPTLEEVTKGWQPWKKELQQVAETFDKPILFAEYGYRSVDYAGKEPWQSSREMKGVNLQAQENLLQGLYQELWQEPWFAGGFLWKWHIQHQAVGGMEDTQFSPQNKPAQQIVKRAYQK